LTHARRAPIIRVHGKSRQNPGSGMNLQVLLVPYDSGQRGVRMGAGPEHLWASGLRAHLAACGHSVFLEVIEAASAVWRSEISTSFELMRAVGARVRAARALGRFPLVLSGNCNVAVGVLAGLGARHGVLWFDAHADFNTPETTTTGFLDGMALATVTGHCWREMAHAIGGFQAVPERNVALLGARDLNKREDAALARSEIIRFSVSEASARLIPLLREIMPPVNNFYLHLDLDVVDPAVGRANSYAAAGGFARADLIEFLSQITGTVRISALTVSAFDPSCNETGTVAETAFAAITTVLDAQN
jgi:arginase